MLDIKSLIENETQAYSERIKINTKFTSNERIAARAAFRRGATIISDLILSRWQEVERWIPVDEKLPEKHKSVNVMLKDGTYTHSFLLDDDFWAYNVEPTHWKYKITPESTSVDPHDKTSED